MEELEPEEDELVIVPDDEIEDDEDDEMSSDSDDYIPSGFEDEDLDNEEDEDAEEDAPDSSVDIESPVAEVVPAPEAAQEDFPSEHEGFAISDNRATLYEVALEKTNSEEARELREQIGDSEYLLLRQDYFAAKSRYESIVDDSLSATAIRGSESFRKQYSEVNELLESPILDGLKDTAVKDLLKSAQEEIEGEYRSRITSYVQSGIPPKRAELRVRAELGKEENLYNYAFLTALIQKMPTSKIPAIIKAAFGEDAPSEARSAPSGRPPVPPIGGSGGSGGANRPSQTQGIRPTDAEAQIAKSLGIDPVKFAQRRRG